jgi:arsenite-transporting ATPase
VAEARRALTQLALYGYRVDGVIANRVFDAGDDPWRTGWAEMQRRQLREVVDSFDPLPIFTAGYLAAEPVGAEALAKLGATVYGRADPLAAVAAADFLKVRQEGSVFVMTLALPLVDKDSLDLTRVGDDLVVTVSGRRRVLALPSALRRCHVRGAQVDDGRLEITFQPDPSQFPQATEAHP